jgi:hypothetical protein
MTPFRRRIAPLGLFLLLVSACVLQERGSDVAGTSVGTGNPGKLKLGFNIEDSAYRFAGSISLFADRQISVPGVDPDPLAVFPVEPSNEFILAAENVAAIPDSIWPSNSRTGDSIRRFNLVVSNSSFGAIVKGIGLDLTRREFLPYDSQSAIVENRKFEVAVELHPMKPLTAKINPIRLENTNHNFLFVYGSGFYAKSDSGEFIFPPMPTIEYEMSFVSFPGENRPTTSLDSSYIYGVAPIITHDSGEVRDVSGLIEQIPLPEAYKE